MTVTRRTAMQGAAAGAGLMTMAAAGGGEAAAQAPARGRTFVLIHGAWHGGWCWARVRDILVAKGHRVYTQSLTGLADRSHLLSTAITLDTHITDIVNLFKWEDIENAVLVGHSYGGWPMSGAIEKVLPQVASIVYLDAFMPENGQKGADQTSEGFRKALQEAIAKGEAGRPNPPASAFKILAEKDVAWVTAKMTMQPVGVGQQPIVLTGAREKVAKKTYIRASAYPQPFFDGYLTKCKADPSWRTFELKPEESGHDVMVDAPARLAQILEEVA